LKWSPNRSHLIKERLKNNSKRLSLKNQRMNKKRAILVMMIRSRYQRLRMLYFLLVWKQSLRKSNKTFNYQRRSPKKNNTKN